MAVVERSIAPHRLPDRAGGAPSLPGAARRPRAGGWVAVRLPASLRSIGFEHVTWTGSRFIAGGWGEYATSPDGRRWTRVKGGIDPDPFSTPGAPASAVDVARSGSRWVAVGTAGGDGPCASWCEPDRGLVWSSRNGSTWTRAPRQASLDGASLTSVVRFGGRWVAAGSKGLDAAAWTSRDGRTWTRVGKRAFARRADWAAGGVSDLITFGGLVVAAGTDGGQDDSLARAWWSADGVTWHRATMDHATGGQVFALADAGSELLAVGPSAGCTGGVWASIDGQSWSCVGSGRRMQKFGPWDAAASGRVEVLVGVTDEGWDEDSDGGMPGAIWWRPRP
ncbi:MAG TPA: hypothetical protein VFY23_01530 [Candidatus Limnocylindrales bacterium]|nr:hypothetical protein [Candidatus Limnocylindrales bacterium]